MRAARLAFLQVDPRVIPVTHERDTARRSLGDVGPPAPAADRSARTHPGPASRIELVSRQLSPARQAGLGQRGPLGLPRDDQRCRLVAAASVKRIPTQPFARALRQARERGSLLDCAVHRRNASRRTLQPDTTRYPFTASPNVSARRARKHHSPPETLIHQLHTWERIVTRCGHRAANPNFETRSSCT